MRKKEERKDEKDLSRFCPICGATLSISQKNWVYCPNKYTARACSFRGRPGAAKTTVHGADGNIPELATASDEQKAIFDYCATGIRK